MLGSLNIEIYAQSRQITKKKKPKIETNFWKEKMWYGGGFNLNFYSTYLAANIPGNIFSIGISPIAGYKIKPWWSVGPRIEMGYLGGKFDYSPEILKLNGFNFGFGAFTRLKFAKVLFAHLEFSTISSLFLTGNIINNNKIETERQFREHTYLGLGYNPSSDFSYEFYLLYDFNSDPNSTQLPIQYRAGITYNF